MANLGGRFFFEVQEADHDVGNLDAGVVNVVLHVDLVAGGAEQADERVAEDGVAQVADVRGLVGVDARCVRRARGLARTAGGASAWATKRAAGGAVEIGVDVPSAGDFEFGEAGERAEGGDNLLAMILGALRSLRASSKAMGVAISPRRRSGGVSRGIWPISRSNFSFRTARRRRPSRFSSSRTTREPQKNP